MKVRTNRIDTNPRLRKSHADSSHESHSFKARVDVQDDLATSVDVRKVVVLGRFFGEDESCAFAFAEGYDGGGDEGGWDRGGGR